MTICFLKILKKTQKIDESKIICENCGENNKSQSFNKVFYICQLCKKNYALYVKQFMIKLII